MPKIRFALALVLAGSILSGQDSTPKGHAEGVVVNQVTGAPLAKATVTLIGNMPRMAPGQQLSPNSYNAVTDRNGRFVIDPVEPGRYSVSAEHPGFTRLNNFGNGASNLVVGVGQTSPSLRLVLLPKGTIAGRVTDEDGDPITEVQIQLQHWMTVNGRKQLQGAGFGMNSVDDQGNFRIANLEPGKYVVSASVMQMGGMVRFPGGNNLPPIYVQTYYPSTTDLGGATTIPLQAGGDVRGIEIRLRKERVYTVTGKLVDAQTGEPLKGVTVGIRGSSERSNSYTLAQDGKFNFGQKLAGSYVIVPGGNMNTGDATYSSKGRYFHFPLTISDRDVTDLVIPVSPAATLTGSVVDESGAPVKRAVPPQSPAAQAARAQIPPEMAAQMAAQMAATLHPNIRLQPMENNFSNQPQIQVKDDGSFTAADVTPGEYRVFVSNYGQGYVKSIRFGTQDVTHDLLNLGSGPGELKIVISSKAADISGTVKSDSGDAISGVTVTVTRVVAQGAMPEQPSISRTDNNGNFKLSSLAPGQYRVLAWEAFDFNLMNDPEVLARFDSRAVTVKLDEGDHGTADLKSISQTEMQTEAAKVQ